LLVTFGDDFDSLRSRRNICSPQRKLWVKPLLDNQALEESDINFTPPFSTACRKFSNFPTSGDVGNKYAAVSTAYLELTLNYDVSLTKFVSAIYDSRFTIHDLLFAIYTF